MPRKQFCNVENSAFPDSEFVRGPNGTTVHVTEWAGTGKARHAKDGHSLDGWIATWDSKTEKLVYEKHPIFLDVSAVQAARIV